MRIHGDGGYTAANREFVLRLEVWVGLTIRNGSRAEFLPRWLNRGLDRGVLGHGRGKSGALSNGVLAALEVLDGVLTRLRRFGEIGEAAPLGDLLVAHLEIGFFVDLAFCEGRNVCAVAVLKINVGRADCNSRLGFGDIRCGLARLRKAGRRNCERGDEQQFAMGHAGAPK